MAEEKQPKLSAQQRAALFAQSTRQSYHMLPKKQVDGEHQSVQFNLPKNRLLSKVIVRVKATVSLSSANATVPRDAFSPYGILRRVSLDLNNGFSPFLIPGKDLYKYNVNRLNPDVLNVSDNPRGMTYVENAADADGVDNQIDFQFELPVTLNERDPVGLVLLQNNDTSVTLTVDVATLAEAYDLQNGDTATFQSMEIQPMIETFSIPPVPQAFPDLSVLKLVSSKYETFTGGGQSITRLSVGTIYRQLVLYFEDENGNPLDESDFAGDIELVFNQVDVPYQMQPAVLAKLNTSQLGYPLPKGMYAWDFSNQGIPNMGGARDYIDTEKLTEFWVRYATNVPGKVTIVHETLSRLKQA